MTVICGNMARKERNDEHFGLSTIVAMIADMCESLTCSRELATDREGLEDFVDTLEQIAEAADIVNDALQQIGVMVAYCESSYGKDETADFLAEVGIDPAVIAEAQQATEYLRA